MSKSNALTILVLGLMLSACGGAQRKVSQYDLGQLMLKNGKAEEAIKAFQRSLALDPEDPTPRHALAEQYYAKGWRAQAMQEWEKAWELSSTDPAFYAGEGKPVRSAAWIADGIESHKAAQERLLAFYLEDAETAAKESRWAESAAAFKRVCELDPAHVKAWPGWAKAAKKLGQKDVAYEAWKKSSLLLPKEADIYKELGYAAYGLQKLNEAEAAFRRYGALNPDDPKGYNNQGTVLAELGKFGEAQAAFDRALQIEKDMIPALNGKGTAYYYEKDYDKARKAWARVLELAPDDPVAKENIRTLVKMGY
jgi:tetratricopeptide (TPR) repeat protein